MHFLISSYLSVLETAFNRVPSPAQCTMHFLISSYLSALDKGTNRPATKFEALNALSFLRRRLQFQEVTIFEIAQEDG